MCSATILTPKLCCLVICTYNVHAASNQIDVTTTITPTQQSTQVRSLLRQLLPTTWPHLSSPTKLHLLLFTERNHPPPEGWFPRQRYHCRPLQQLLIKKQISQAHPLFILHLSELPPTACYNQPSLISLLEKLFGANGNSSGSGHALRHVHTFHSNSEEEGEEEETIWFQCNSIVQGFN